MLRTRAHYKTKQSIIRDGEGIGDENGLPRVMSPGWAKAVRGRKVRGGGFRGVAWAYAWSGGGGASGAVPVWGTLARGGGGGVCISKGMWVDVRPGLVV